MFFRKMKIKCVLLLFLFVPSVLLAANKVNVLAWFGYLKFPEIHKVVKEKCGVDFSYDKYYTNVEFLRRFSASSDQYDIIL